MDVIFVILCTYEWYVPTISLNTVICNIQTQTKTHSSYEITHCTPSLINTITVWLSTNDMGNVNIFNAARLFLMQRKSKAAQQCGWSAGLAAEDPPPAPTSVQRTGVLTQLLLLQVWWMGDQKVSCYCAGESWKSSRETCSLGAGQNRTDDAATKAKRQKFEVLVFMAESWNKSLLGKKCNSCAVCPKMVFFWWKRATFLQKFCMCVKNKIKLKHKFWYIHCWKLAMKKNLLYNDMSSGD